MDFKDIPQWKMHHDSVIIPPSLEGAKSPPKRRTSSKTKKSEPKSEPSAHSDILKEALSLLAFIQLKATKEGNDEGSEP